MHVEMRRDMHRDAGVSPGFGMAVLGNAQGVVEDEEDEEGFSTDETLDMDGLISRTGPNI